MFIAKKTYKNTDEQTTLRNVCVQEAHQEWARGKQQWTVAQNVAKNQHKRKK